MLFLTFSAYFSRAIVVVRHPLDATISGFSFFKTRGSHTKTAKMDKFIAGGKPTNGKMISSTSYLNELVVVP